MILSRVKQQIRIDCYLRKSDQRSWEVEEISFRVKWTFELLVTGANIS